MKSIIKYVGMSMTLVIALGTTTQISAAQRRRPMTGAQAEQRIDEATQKLANMQPGQDKTNLQTMLALNKMVDLCAKLQADLNVLSQRVDDLSKRVPSPQFLQGINTLLTNHDNAIKGLLKALSGNK